MLKEHQPTISEAVSEEDTFENMIIVENFTRLALLTWVTIFTCVIKELRFFKEKNVYMIYPEKSKLNYDFNVSLTL